MVTDSIGAQNREYTSISAGIGVYQINMGDKAFDARAYTPSFKATLIHEMTHVWQGHHGRLGLIAVWGSSIICQIQRQGNAYLYGEGNLNRKDWGDFGAEEQAQIVQDWYENGMLTTDPRFHFIRDNIRMGKT
jgi:hypothetical protein